MPPKTTKKTPNNDPKPASKKATAPTPHRYKVTLTETGFVVRITRPGGWFTADVEYDGQIHQFRADVLAVTQKGVNLGASRWA